MACALPLVRENDLMAGVDVHLPPKTLIPPNAVAAKVRRDFECPSEWWLKKTSLYVEDEIPAPHLHDLGINIPHVPSAWLSAVSSSKVMLGSFSVYLHDKPAGLSAASMGPVPCMLNCSDPVPAPLGTLMLRGLPSVLVGFSNEDLIASIFYASQEMLWSLFLSKVGDGIMKRLGKGLEKLKLETLEQIRKTLEELLKELAQTTIDKLLQQVEDGLTSKPEEPNDARERRLAAEPRRIAETTYDALYPASRRIALDVAAANGCAVDESAVQLSREEFADLYEESAGPEVKGALGSFAE